MESIRCPYVTTGDCELHGTYLFRLGWTEFLKPQCSSCWEDEVFMKMKEERARKLKEKKERMKVAEKENKEREEMEADGWVIL